MLSGSQYFFVYKILREIIDKLKKIYILKFKI